MRNLAIVLSGDRFERIERRVPHLLGSEAGRNLFNALRARDYEAMHVREHAIGPGRSLLASGDVTELFVRTLKIPAGSHERHELSRIVLS